MTPSVLALERLILFESSKVSPFLSRQEIVVIRQKVLPLCIRSPTYQLQVHNRCSLVVVLASDTT